MISQTCGARVCGNTALERLSSRRSISGVSQSPLHSVRASRHFCRRRAEKSVSFVYSGPIESSLQAKTTRGVLKLRSQQIASVRLDHSGNRAKSGVPSAATMVSDMAKVGDIPNDWDDEKETSGMHAGVQLCPFPAKSCKTVFPRRTTFQSSSKLPGWILEALTEDWTARCMSPGYCIVMNICDVVWTRRRRQCILTAHRRSCLKQRYNGRFSVSAL